MYFFSVTLGRTLQWRHNGRDGVSNHQPHHCLFNRPFRRRSKKTSKLRVIGLCAGNSSVAGEFPTQIEIVSSVENCSIWWRHHEHDGSNTELKNNYSHCISVSRLWVLCKHNLILNFNVLAIKGEQYHSRTFCRHFTDDVFKCIFTNDNKWTSLKIPLKFVPNVWINNIPALVRIMAWRRPGAEFTDSYMRHSASVS